MEPIYVTGHRNPDTDSIVSAMAYAALRNALGEWAYVAARLGPVSDETQMVLDRFGFEPPQLLRDVRTQVRDLEYDTPPAIHRSVTVSRAWSVLKSDHGILAMPVTDDEGKLFGMLTPGDIAAYDMRSMDDPRAEKLPMCNLLSALEGHIIHQDGDAVYDTVSGDVVIALPQRQDSLVGLRPGAIVLVGDQPDMLKKAAQAGACCLIVCQAEVEEAVLEGLDKDVPVISTPCDVYRAARMIFQAAPVDRVCNTQDMVAFRLDDYIDDVREKMLESRFRCYPVLDEKGMVAGTVSRFHLIRPRRKKVVLVDHNERSQSVPGLDQADILEIIDHHRLADVQTGGPVFFRNEPVGSTATIVATMYQERGLMPPPKLAGLICAAIVSDTVLFKSPTCTQRDHVMAQRMARVAGISIEELGHDIFAASSVEEKPAQSLYLSDFKEFRIAGHAIGIGQVTCLDAQRVLRRLPELLQVMEAHRAAANSDMELFMITDVLKEGTELIVLGDEDIISQAFGVEIKDHHVFLPKVVSRKKQVVPMLSLLWG